ncbi:MAG: type III polyketide synthase [Myxococcota bacterium]
MTAPSIASVARALPPHYHPQQELTRALLDLWTQHQTINRSRVESLHQSVQVRGRHLAIPMGDYPALDTFEKRNAVWIREAQRLGEQAVRAAVAKAGLELRDVDALCFTSITGLATPSIDARLINALGLRPDVKRLPVFGLGCVAGVAGTARVSDLLRGFPEHTAVLLSVELCSLTVQRRDISVSNLIAAGLFGDGAAAVVLRGGGHEARGPKVLASESVFYPDTEGVMGWEFLDSGFKVVLSADVPTMVTKHVRGDVDRFLAKHGLTRRDIRHWVAHTGGPKVLEAFESALELPPEALARSWESLRSVGNLSSASVLYVLSDLLDSQTAKPGDLGLMMAMGPGFCAELVLLRW